LIAEGFVTDVRKPTHSWPLFLLALKQSGFGLLAHPSVPVQWTARHKLGALRCAGCGNVHDVAGLQHDLVIRRSFSPEPGVHIFNDPG
jgi:hypothetical protein